MTIRVLLADDQALLRSAFKVLVDSEPDMEVVAEAADGAQAVALARSEQVDVVLMDIRMPGTDGLAATRMITADPELSAVRIVMLTTFEVDEYVVQSLRAGASGFLVKDMGMDEILGAVRVVAAGDGLIAPGVTRRLIKEFADRPANPAPARPLTAITEREREVLALVGSGLNNTEIASRLVISVATAKTYVTRLLAKLDARDRVHLVIIAYEAGLVGRA